MVKIILYRNIFQLFTKTVFSAAAFHPMESFHIFPTQLKLKPSIFEKLASTLKLKSQLNNILSAQQLFSPRTTHCEWTGAEHAGEREKQTCFVVVGVFFGEQNTHIFLVIFFPQSKISRVIWVCNTKKEVQWGVERGVGNMEEESDRRQFVKLGKRSLTPTQSRPVHLKPPFPPPLLPSLCTNGSNHPSAKRL